MLAIFLICHRRAYLGDIRAWGEALIDPGMAGSGLRFLSQSLLVGGISQEVTGNRVCSPADCWVGSQFILVARRLVTGQFDYGVLKGEGRMSADRTLHLYPL
jgi:hypothetical protein